MARPLVVVFARAPRYGAVKTRLARDIGGGEALRFYRDQLRRVLQGVGRDARWETLVCVTPDAAVRVRGLWPTRARLSAQGAGDLGRRMLGALRAAGARPTVVVGSDIPGLLPRHVAAAFRALGTASYVLGPARDGGYWLIGARHPARARRTALDGVRWSSAETLADTAARLRDVAVLDTVLDDVDDGTGYRRLRQ